MKLNQVIHEGSNDIIIVHRSKGSRKNGVTADGELETDYSHMDPLPGNFFASDVGLKTLKGCPGGFIEKSCVISGNELTTLEFGPTKVRIDYDCSQNPLTSLEHAPMEVGGNMFAWRCKNLRTLSGIGRNFLKSCGSLSLRQSPLESSILGILLIKRLTHDRLMYDGEREEPRVRALIIIENHLADGSDILDCKEELIEAGLKEYAKL